MLTPGKRQTAPLNPRGIPLPGLSVFGSLAKRDWLHGFNTETQPLNAKKLKGQGHGEPPLWMAGKSLPHHEMNSWNHSGDY